MQPSSIDVSIQSRDDVITRVGDEGEPVILNPSQSVTTVVAEQMPERKRKKRTRDMAYPFMILILMDFMIVLLLWIVYEAVSGVH